MEITLNDCTLLEAMEEMKYHQSCGREAYFEGVGNGNVIIKVPSIFILSKLTGGKIK